ncbi:MAG: FAD-binding oxidoreductase [Candidatus Paceibacterota bacterium]
MKEEILKFFAGEVDDSEETLAKYSLDASLLRVKPKLVLFPKDKEDVKKLVKWAGEFKDLYDHPGNPGTSVSITARCAGTDMSGGAIGESLILDFTKYMNKLVGGPLPLGGAPKSFKKNKDNKLLQAYPQMASSITVQSGMFYRDFEKITLAKGLILPCYTASKNINAMGGMFGNNSAGERTLKYGQMENYVLSSKVVFADGNEYEVKPLNRDELDRKMAQGDFEGNVYKNILNLINENEGEILHAKPAVSKNSAGYYIWNVVSGRGKDFKFDLNKLLVGSQGTLGLVTEMTLKVLPDNIHTKLVAISMDDLAPLGRVVDEILTFNPESLETYDDKTMKLAVKFFPDFLKNKGLVQAVRVLKSFWPEFKMFLFGGMPKLVILAEFAGENDKEVEAKCAKLKSTLSHFKLEVHITSTTTEANKYWDIRRESFALLRKHVKGMRTAPFIDDIIVRPEFLPKFLPELNVLLNQYRGKLIYTLAGHAGNGNFHVIPLMDFSRPDTAKTILGLSDKVFELVLRYHGSLAAEHNDGLIRTPYLASMYGERVTKIFAKIKDIFDSKNILNPGKKVPMKNIAGDPGAQAGTKEYIARHVALEHHAVHKV